jgi:isopentenyl diphosphate isomerase/L-lactate dehydrogenase-like FMN-dependent dehydrogenase
MSAPSSLLTLADYEAKARELMPRPLFDVLFGAHGTPGFEANTRNLDAFAALTLRPRVMRNVANRDLSTTVLGEKISLPVMIAPAGSHQRGHPDGELATARAARAAGTILTVSTVSTYSIEEVAEADSGPLWFQLYLYKNRPLTELLVRRAEQAGYKAIMLTVDQLGARSQEREVRFDFQIFGEERVVHTISPERVLRNFAGVDLPEMPTGTTMAASFEDNMTWAEIAWLRGVTGLPIVLKGIQTAEDAALAVEHGVDAIVVSNHGGHALPEAEATLTVLPEVVDAVRGRIEVYVDGGVRRGSDVLKAMAIGARAVFIGRPLFWGLSVAGADGVLAILQILRDELDSAMALCGVRTCADISPALVRPATPLRFTNRLPE